MKSKSKKKETTSKPSKKKDSKQPTKREKEKEKEKPSKKKKTNKKSIAKNDNQDLNDQSLSIIEQKEKNHQMAQDNENNNNENNPNPNEEAKVEEENLPPIRLELSIGTPHFTNISDLKNELEDKTQKINKENTDQENYKLSLNSLLNELNKTISENMELLYGDDNSEEAKRKRDNIAA